LRKSLRMHRFRRSHDRESRESASSDSQKRSSTSLRDPESASR
jgi:hypothetical protein